MRMKSLSHSYRSVKSYPTIIMTLFTTPDKSGNIHSSLQGGGSHGKRVFQFPNPNFDAWPSCSFIFTIKVSIWGYPMISPIFKQAHHVPIKLTQRPLPPRLLHGCLQNLRTPKRKRKQLQHQAVLEVAGWWPPQLGERAKRSDSRNVLTENYWKLWFLHVYFFSPWSFQQVSCLFLVVPSSYY